MSQNISLHSLILDDSARLIAALQKRAMLAPCVQDALAYHTQLHRELEAAQVESERALLDWRTALTQRWDCEVKGQRIYMQILEQLCDNYGDDSPEVRVISPDHTPLVGTALDLLHEMQRLHASLLLMKPALMLNGVSLSQLEAACARLEQALIETQNCETRRRKAGVISRMVQQTCQRAITETQRSLNERLGKRITLESSFYAEAALEYGT